MSYIFQFPGTNWLTIVPGMGNSGQSILTFWVSNNVLDNGRTPFPFKWNFHMTSLSLNYETHVLINFYLIY